MEELFVPYEESLALKELGFNEVCFGLWEETDKGIAIFWGNEVTIQYCLNVAEHEGRIYHCKAPLYQQAFKWFREKYDLNHTICIVAANEYGIWIHKDRNLVKSGKTVYSLYEEAELECLRKLIEIVKSKKK